MALISITLALLVGFIIHNLKNDTEETNSINPYCVVQTPNHSVVQYFTKGGRLDEVRMIVHIADYLSSDFPIGDFTVDAWAWKGGVLDAYLTRTDTLVKYRYIQAGNGVVILEELERDIEFDYMEYLE